MWTDPSFPLHLVNRSGANIVHQTARRDPAGSFCAVEPSDSGSRPGSVWVTTTLFYVCLSNRIDPRAPGIRWGFQKMGFLFPCPGSGASLPRPRSCLHLRNIRPVTAFTITQYYHRLAERLQVLPLRPTTRSTPQSISIPRVISGMKSQMCRGVHRCLLQYGVVWKWRRLWGQLLHDATMLGVKQPFSSSTCDADSPNN